MTKAHTARFPGVARRRIANGIAAALLAACGTGSAFAFQLDTSNNPDLSVRLDTTVRLNYGVRTQARDNKIGNDVIADEGDYSFNKGDAVAKRLDLLTELDIIYKDRYGMRVSAAGWYDGAYGDKSASNPNLPFRAIPSYVGNEYSNYVQRFYAGPSGELLDAFVFGTFDIGSVPLSVKAGQHSIYWGESLFLNGNLNSVAYAQNPLDLQKGFATPGTEAKELFQPLNQVSATAQVTDTLSFAGQYLLNWSADRYPEGGTYLGPVDFAFNGPDRQFVSAGLGFAYRGPPSNAPDNGDWGLASRWSPQWLDGTLGFYYRNFSDKLPQTFITKVGPNSASRYNLIYADNIDLFGVSLAKNIGGISLGAEASYRHNTPLNSQVLGIAPGLPAEGDTKGPRGDTYHALVNALGVIPQNPLFDTASWSAELTWASWAKVTSGQNLFFAEGFAPCKGKDVGDGCTTKDYTGLSLAFSPTWFHVFPSVDLLAPITYSRGLNGNAPTVFGGNQDNGNYSVGIAADIQSKYRVDLKYIQYFGSYKDNGTAVTSQNGFTTLLSDRGFVNLTFKTTF